MDVEAKATRLEAATGEAVAQAMEAGGGGAAGAGMSIRAEEAGQVVAAPQAAAQVVGVTGESANKD